MKVFTFLLIIIVCLYNFGVRAAMDNSKHSDEAEKLLAELSASKGEGEGEPKSTVSVFYLQPDEVNTLSHQAKRGDGEAGFRLFMYYKFSNYDEEKSSQWLKIAANNGHATAQYRLYVDLQEQGETKKANEWLQKIKLAASNNDSSAMWFLVNCYKNLGNKKEALQWAYKLKARKQSLDADRLIEELTKEQK